MTNPDTPLRIIIDEIDVILEEMTFINHGLATIDSEETTGAVFLLGHIVSKLDKLVREAKSANQPSTGGYQPILSAA